MNFEDIIGFFQVTQSRHEHREIFQEVSVLKTKFVELIYSIIHLEQKKNLKNILNHQNHEWLLKLMDEIKNALWVFNLNYDCLIEILALEQGIDLRMGYGSGKLNFTKKKQKISFNKTNRADLLGGKYDFHRIDEEGINMMKLHGGLGEFTVNDARDSITLFDNTKKSAEYINELDVLNRYEVVPVNNEILVNDNLGEIQFLRRTQIAGSLKFSSRYTQTQPEFWLNRFSCEINNAEKLICVGYSFMDSHINNILQNWLSFNTFRRLKIIDPYLKDVPKGFRHLSLQVEVPEVNPSDILSSIS